LSKLSFDDRSILYYDEYESYVIEFVKEVIPRQLVKLKESDLMLKSESLKQHIGSIMDMFNLSNFDFNNIRTDIEKILKDKYGYIIKSDDPLVMEKIK
jgi:hypothetical protein